MFENYRKSRILHCERSELPTFTFQVIKSALKMRKIVNLASFKKRESSGQTVLPDRSILIGQKLLENAKIQCDILGDFKTLCRASIFEFSLENV